MPDIVFHEIEDNQDNCKIIKLVPRAVDKNYIPGTA